MENNNDAFSVVHENYTFAEAVKEAKRCLNCKIPQCRKGCPIDNHIPDFIHQLSKGNIGDAMAILNETTNLPAICGRVCPHEKQCQGHCVMGKKGEPVQIGRLEAFVADFDAEMGLTHEHIPEKTRGKVAVIGSGPAGLTVAGELARKGFAVTIYEGQEEPGGVLMYGIPAYRLAKDVVRKEIKKIEALGVRFVNNCLVGQNGMTIETIFAEGFDAIFMGTGTALAREMDIPGSTLHGIGQSIYLLHNVNSFKEGAMGRNMVPVKEGEKVGVIGGGNVAMDAARTALRFGADVTVIYRKTQEDMPAIKAEYEEAVAEGVKFLWQTNATEFIGNEKNRLKQVRLSSPDGEHLEPFDRIFLAIGSRPAARIVSTTEGIETDDKGYVITQERPHGMTTRVGVFAAGDVVHRPQTVVMAMKAAKETAEGIAQYVDAIHLMKDVGLL